ncbi:uncharacterized protein BCR38DRAFT_472501 [Pseudomassariella vexata]|uniref:Bacteriophage T5 Orf172 DNA-binding domain-containing protein n=1 Tax=Pseudomassariella vexata TaxID=1141098 RepID=A0A1Y2E5Y4_9PEZI|nr:uncharacterized protein BCR38DRAFT_472501 [Pseudomassariella vexata]ORY66970.1 hypothetical protein BCR38DRAFT_472501 [Pseudomassariella vexata]
MPNYHEADVYQLSKHIRDVEHLKEILEISSECTNCFAFAPKSAFPGQCSRVLGRGRSLTIRGRMNDLLKAINSSKGEEDEGVLLRLRDVARAAICMPGHVVPVFKHGYSYATQEAYVEALLQSRLRSYHSSITAVEKIEDTKTIGKGDDVVSINPSASTRFDSNSATKFEPGASLEEIIDEDKYNELSHDNTIETTTIVNYEAKRHVASAMRDALCGQTGTEASRPLYEQPPPRTPERPLLQYLSSPSTYDASSPESVISEEPTRLFDLSDSYIPEETPLKEDATVEASFLGKVLSESPLARPAYLSKTGKTVDRHNDLSYEHASSEITEIRALPALPPPLIKYTSVGDDEAPDGCGEDEVVSTNTCENSRHADSVVQYPILRRRHSHSHLGSNCSKLDNSCPRSNVGPPALKLRLFRKQSMDLEDFQWWENSIYGPRSDYEEDQAYNLQRFRSRPTRKGIDGNMPTLGTKREMRFGEWKTQNNMHRPIHGIIHRIRESLTNTTHVSGYVYCFRERSNLDFRKIGYVEAEPPTAYRHQDGCLNSMFWQQSFVGLDEEKAPPEVQERLDTWGKICSLDAVHEFSIFMPCAVRSMEALIHKSLHKYHRKVVECRRADCTTQHQEWFQLEKHAARDVVHLWRTFSQSEPYGQSGVLCEFWSNKSWEMYKASFFDRSNVKAWMESHLKSAIEQARQAKDKKRIEKFHEDLLRLKYDRNRSEKYILRVGTI